MLEDAFWKNVETQLQDGRGELQTLIDEHQKALTELRTRIAKIDRMLRVMSVPVPTPVKKQPGSKNGISEQVLSDTIKLIQDNINQFDQLGPGTFTRTDLIEAGASQWVIARGVPELRERGVIRMVGKVPNVKGHQPEVYALVAMATSANSDWSSRDDS
jgi:hypothetical protein